jgi:hypothetical protein
MYIGYHGPAGLSSGKCGRTDGLSRFLCFLAWLEHTAKSDEDEMSFSSPAYDMGVERRNRPLTRAATVDESAVEGHPLPKGRGC